MAKIAKKKRKVNRSRSAKKGWATRRKQDPELARRWRLNRAKEKARAAKRTTEESIIEKEVERRLREREADIRASVRKEVEKSTALKYEKMRSQLVAKTVDEVLVDAPEGFVETDFSKIRARMDIADLSGDPELEAGVLADEFGYEVRDIWTIYYGSDPDAA